MAVISKEQFRQAAEWMAHWRRPVLLSHAKPDGDAIGSLSALRSLLAGRGSAPAAVLYEPLPDRYSWMGQDHDFEILDAPIASERLDRADGIIIVDTCSFSQLEPVAAWLRASKRPKLVVDHHATGDELADRYLIDDSAAATCLLIEEWAAALGWPVDRSTAASLMVGLATDTGWFRHANTDQRALRTAAKLVACGASASNLYERLYSQDTASRVRLLGEALASLELHAGDRVAIMQLPNSAFVRCGAKPSETEDIVNEPLRIASVVVSVLLVEQEDGPVRVNLRSKPADEGLGRPLIDVSAIARNLGGGGHRNAAGARLDQPLPVVRGTLLQQVADALGPPQPLPTG